MSGSSITRVRPLRRVVINMFEEDKNTTPVSDPKGTPPAAPESVTIPKSEFEGLKSQIEEMNKFRTETEDYLKGASVVVTTLASDPELTKAFRAKMGMVDEGQGAGQQQQQVPSQTTTPANGSGKTEGYNKDLEDVKSSQREEIVSAFERDYGIVSLPEDQRKEARRKVEGFLNEFGWSVKTMPLTQLRSSMEKAYVGTHAEKLKEDGKLEGFTQAFNNSQGMMGSFPGGTTPSAQVEDLNPKQKEWAEKLGVDPEKAKKTYLSRNEEEKRLSGAEKRIQGKSD